MEWLSIALCWIEQHPGLASWLQAFFSVFAIFGAFLISKRQFTNAQDLLIQELKAAGIATAKAVECTSKVSVNVVAYAATHIRNKDSLTKIRNGAMHFDLQALLDVEASLNSVPKHQLDPEIIAYTFMLSGTVRQVRELSQKALQKRNGLDDVEFEELCESITKLQLSLAKTNDDIAKAVAAMTPK